MTYFWLINSKFDKFRDIPCYRIIYVFINGLRDSVRVFHIEEIIGIRQFHSSYMPTNTRRFENQTWALVRKCSSVSVFISSALNMYKVNCTLNNLNYNSNNQGLKSPR